MPKDYILEWDPDAWKKSELIPHLVSNSEIVGEFVESDARRRLLAIAVPEWGKPYRREVVSRLLDNFIEQGKNEVITMVGVRKSKSGSHHGFYIELGSRTAPPQPFLRPAVFENGKKIVALIEGK